MNNSGGCQVCRFLRRGLELRKIDFMRCCVLECVAWKVLIQRKRELQSERRSSGRCSIKPFPVGFTFAQNSHRCTVRLRSSRTCQHHGLIKENRMHRYIYDTSSPLPSDRNAIENIYTVVMETLWLAPYHPLKTEVCLEGRMGVRHDWGTQGVRLRLMACLEELRLYHPPDPPSLHVARCLWV